METGMRVGTIGRMTEKEKQLLFAHRELLLYAQRHRKVMNYHNDFSRGYQWGLEESQDMIFQYVKKILDL